MVVADFCLVSSTEDELLATWKQTNASSALLLQQASLTGSDQKRIPNFQYAQKVHTRGFACTTRRT